MSGHPEINLRQSYENLMTSFLRQSCNITYDNLKTKVFCRLDGDHLPALYKPAKVSDEQFQDSYENYCSELINANFSHLLLHITAQSVHVFTVHVTDRVLLPFTCNMELILYATLTQSQGYNSML